MRRQHVQSSSLPMGNLRFGDCSDGVAMLGVNGGRWAISEAQRAGGSWSPSRRRCPRFIADLDNNNIGDISTEMTSLPPSWVHIRSPILGTFRMTGGRPGVAEDLRLGHWTTHPQRTLLVDSALRRVAALSSPGRTASAIYSPAEEAVGATPDWRSLFSY
jgi:hypothetical protein